MLGLSAIVSYICGVIFGTSSFLLYLSAYYPTLAQENGSRVNLKSVFPGVRKYDAFESKTQASNLSDVNKFTLDRLLEHNLVILLDVDQFNGDVFPSVGISQLAKESQPRVASRVFYSTDRLKNTYDAGHPSQTVKDDSIAYNGRK